jgi:signal transduction histidine kinase
MNDVLILGKITSDTNSYYPKLFNIIDFCKEIVSSFSLARKDGRSLEFEVKGEPYDFKLDPQLLTHSLTNLVDNAFKYSLGRKNPELTLSFNTDEISFRIKDYGIGIPEYDLSKMFQPFFRAENVTEIEGTGLGLSIAKEFVNKNKGVITISSIEGQGCDIEMIYKRV